MALRSYLIHFMLVVLCVTGVGAAFAAIRDSTDDNMRVFETAIASIIATFAVLPFCNRADDRESRSESLIGMTIVMLMFGTSQALIWGLVQRWFGPDVEWRTWMTLLAIAVTGVPAAFKFRLLHLAPHRIAGVFGIVVSATVLTLYLIGTWHPKEYEFNNVYHRTGWTIVITGLLANGAMLGASVRPWRFWRWTGVIAATFACVLMLRDVWHDDDFNPKHWWKVAALCLAAAIAHLVVCLLVPLGRLQKWMRVATSIAAFTAAASVSTVSWGEAHDKSWSAPMKATNAAGVLACCGTLSLLVLARYNRGLDRKPVLTQIREMMVICPGCETQEKVCLGKTACSSCGLIFNIGVEEPRCPSCDYLLYMHRGARCPECGLELPRHG